MSKAVKLLLMSAAIFLILWVVFISFYQRKQATNELPVENLQNTKTLSEGAPDLEVRQPPAIPFDDLAKSIKEQYKDDAEFMRCADDVVQSCLSEVIGRRITQTGDLSLCDDFLTQDAKDNCRLVQSTNLARIKKDDSFCETLTDSQRVNCRAEVAAIQAFDGEDLSLCDALGEGAGSCKEAAAARLAQETGDATWCDSVENDRREICQQEVEFYAQQQAQQNAINATIEQNQDSALLINQGTEIERPQDEPQSEERPRGQELE